MKYFLRFSGKKKCGSVFVFVFTFTQWYAGRLSPPKICGSYLFPWCQYLCDGWLQAPNMNLLNTELEGICITDSQEPGYSGLCTTQELGSLWRYPPCGCLSWGRRWSQGAGGGGELCPNYGKQEHLISFLGATPKPELSPVELLSFLFFFNWTYIPFEGYF